MKPLLNLFYGIAFLVSVSAPVMAADTYVQGYTRSNGTYVAPYHRTTPDSTVNNNYSTAPNVNPYTGKEGTKAPNPSEPLYPSTDSIYGTP